MTRRAQRHKSLWEAGEPAKKRCSPLAQPNPRRVEGELWGNPHRVEVHIIPLSEVNAFRWHPINSTCHKAPSTNHRRVRPSWHSRLDRWKGFLKLAFWPNFRAYSLPLLVNVNNMTVSSSLTFRMVCNWASLYLFGANSPSKGKTSAVHPT